MNSFKWFLISFICMFIFCWITLTVHALSNTIEIDGQIFIRSKIIGISKIQKPYKYTLSTVRNSNEWYFLVYYKNPQPRNAAVITAYTKSDILLKYRKMKHWLGEN